MSILVLSSNLMNINSGGSYALGRVKAEEQQAGPISYNRISLSGAITKYLIRNNLWRKNIPNFRKRGMGLMRPPKFSLDQKKIYDAESELRIAQQLKGLNAPIILAELYERSGYTQPSPTEPRENLLTSEEDIQNFKDVAGISNLEPSPPEPATPEPAPPEEVPPGEGKPGEKVPPVEPKNLPIKKQKKFEKDVNEDFDDLTKHTAKPVKDIIQEFFRGSPSESIKR